MTVQGMWPYWLDGHSPSTVKNSFDMSSMYLLTGKGFAHCTWRLHLTATPDRLI